MARARIRTTFDFCCFEEYHDRGAGGARPGAEEEAEGLVQELRRLRRHGVPEGHAWSAVLSPLRWLANAAGGDVLAPRLAAAGVPLEVTEDFITSMAHLGVEEPADLLPLVCRLLPVVAEDPGDRRRLAVWAETTAPFGYLHRFAQEFFMDQNPAGERMVYALANATGNCKYKTTGRARTTNTTTQAPQPLGSVT